MEKQHEAYFLPFFHYKEDFGLLLVEDPVLHGFRRRHDLVLQMLVAGQAQHEPHNQRHILSFSITECWIHHISPSSFPSPKSSLQSEESP